MKTGKMWHSIIYEIFVGKKSKVGRYVHNDLNFIFENLHVIGAVNFTIEKIIDQPKKKQIIQLELF